MMRVVHDYPPNIDLIDAAFKTRGRAVIYCYGDTIFAPHSDVVSEALQCHESVHSRQQAELGVDEWWRRYVAEPQFRLDQEVPAHRAEFQWHAARPDADKPAMGFRTKRAYHLHHIAARLCGPLYGNLMSKADARRAVEARTNGRG